MSLINLTSDNFEDTIADGRVMAVFSATWCPPCQVLSPIVDELAKEYEGRAKIGKIDIDEEKALTKRFKVMSVPTVIIFNDGTEVKRLPGVKGKEEYVEELGVS